MGPLPAALIHPFDKNRHALRIRRLPLHWVLANPSPATRPSHHLSPQFRSRREISFSNPASACAITLGAFESHAATR
jgi:hypothetical protein